MKSHDTLEVVYEERPALHVAERLPDAEPGADPGPDEALPRSTTEAERAVMHPDRHDLEWRYCRGGWAG